MVRDIDVLNEEMMAAGVGFSSAASPRSASAKSLRAQPDGKVLITDGPYLETKEHIGGFWILEAADSGRGTGVGAQGCHRLPGAGRGAPVWDTNRRRQLSCIDAARSS